MANSDLDTRSDTVDARSMKAPIHTMETVITLLNTRARDTPFTLQKRNTSSGNLAGKRHADREVSKQVLSDSVKILNFAATRFSLNFFYRCFVSLSPLAKIL